MWWLNIVAALVIVVGVLGFLSLAGFEKRLLSRRSQRRAEDLYGHYRDDGQR